MHDRRRAARLAAQYRVVFRPGWVAYIGTVVSISQLGARIEVPELGHLPKLGETLRLRLDVWDPPLELDSLVVNVSPGSFAVEFRDPPVDLLDLLTSLGG